VGRTEQLKGYPMSKATPMTAERRRATYLAQTGAADLTPAQRRRLQAKERAATAEARQTTDGGRLPRFARLRRRYDRKDTRQVKTVAREMVAATRARRGY